MFVPVEPPTGRFSTRDTQRMVAIDAASGTRTMSSMTPLTNDGSTRIRPMPSMRDGVVVVTPTSSETQPSRNADPSGSATPTRVSKRR